MICYFKWRDKKRFCYRNIRRTNAHNQCTVISHNPTPGTHSTFAYLPLFMYARRSKLCWQIKFDLLSWRCGCQIGFAVRKFKFALSFQSTAEFWNHYPNLLHERQCVMNPISFVLSLINISCCHSQWVNN